MKYLYTSLILILTFSLYGQHKDCSDAYWLSEVNEKYEFVFTQGSGQIEDEDKSFCSLASNFGSIGYSHWIKFCVESPGDFYFTAVPPFEEYDIDFIVYRLDAHGNCESKEAIRCMHSGLRFGYDSRRCLGPTGLSPNETDTEEGPGCSDGDNNFLAALQCEEGDNYAIFLESFSRGPDEMIKVEFFGSATLKGFNSTNSIEVSHVSIFPNPVQAEITLENIETGTEVQIFNTTGQRVHEEIWNGNSLSVQHLESGLYYLRSEEITLSFVKL